MSTSKKLQIAMGGAGGAGGSSGSYLDAISYVARITNGSTYRTMIIISPDAFGWSGPSGIFGGSTTTISIGYANDPNYLFTAGAYDYSTDSWVFQGYWGSTLYHDGTSVGIASIGSPEGSYFAAGKDNAFYNRYWVGNNIQAAYNLTDLTDSSDWSDEQSISGYSHNMVVLDDGTAIAASGGFNSTGDYYYKTLGSGTTWGSGTITVLGDNTFSGVLLTDGTTAYWLVNDKVYTSTSGSLWTNSGAVDSNIRIEYYGNRKWRTPAYDSVNDRWVWSNGSTTYTSTNLTSSTALHTHPSFAATVINVLPIGTGELVYICGSTGGNTVYAYLVDDSGTIQDTKSYTVPYGYTIDNYSDTFADAFLSHDYNRVNFSS